MLGYWNTGIMLEYWNNAGILEYWNIGINAEILE
jgi:hypothetical protein